MLYETIICRVGPHTWQREVTRGRKPHYCPEHLYVAGRESGGADVPDNAPEIVADEPTPAPLPELEGLFHENFRRLLLGAKARRPVMLVGPSGSGKTTAAGQVAEILGLSFTPISCTADMPSHALTGYSTATGEFVEGSIYSSIRDGGVVILDEADASSDVVLVLNNLTASEAGKTVVFPGCPPVQIHSDFVIIAGANTLGDGASDEYTRQVLDAAFKNRFAFVAWGYDERLERAIVPTTDTARKWVAFVQRARRLAKEAGIPAMITPRDSVNGVALFDQGATFSEVCEMLIFDRLSEDAANSLRQAIG